MPHRIVLKCKRIATELCATTGHDKPVIEPNLGMTNEARFEYPVAASTNYAPMNIFGLSCEQNMQANPRKQESSTAKANINLNISVDIAPS